MLNSIVDHADYRDFLKERLLLIKKESQKISIGFIAKKIGCSESFFKKIFSKKTHLGLNYLDKVASVFKLTKNEKEILFFLLIYSDSSISEDSKSHLNYIISTLCDKFRNYQNIDLSKIEKKANQIELNTQDYLVHIYLELSKIVRHIPSISDFKEYVCDFIGTNESSFLAQEISELILLKENSSGVHKSISGFSSTYSPASLKSSMYESVQLTADLLDKMQLLKPFTNFASYYAINKNDSDNIIDVLKKARSEVIRIAESSIDPNRIVAVQIFGYHITKLK